MQSPPKALFVALSPIALLMTMIAGMRLLGSANDPATNSPSITPPSMPPIVPLAKPIQRKIETVVTGQTDSIRQGDFRGALTYSVATFRRAVSPKQFANIIHANYRPLIRYRQIQFGTAIGNYQRALAPVKITAADGSVSQFVFGLTNTDHGWCISSCMPEPIARRWSAPPGSTGAHAAQLPRHGMVAAVPAPQVTPLPGTIPGS